jgi:hypothetical protein
MVRKGENGNSKTGNANKMRGKEKGTAAAQRGTEE